MDGTLGSHKSNKFFFPLNQFPRGEQAMPFSLGASILGETDRKPIHLSICPSVHPSAKRNIKLHGVLCKQLGHSGLIGSG